MIPANDELAAALQALSDNQLLVQFGYAQRAVEEKPTDEAVTLINHIVGELSNRDYEMTATVEENKK